MEINIFIFIILIHFLADFGLQTHQQSQLKSTDSVFLAYHIGVYSLVWLIAIMAMGGSFEVSLIFAIVTFISHFITDYFTSRIGSPFWKKEDYHNGFVVVGFDQILHYIQLILTWNILMK